MHQSARTGSGLGFLPAMYSFSGPTSLPQFDFGTPRTSDDLHKLTMYDRYVAVILEGGGDSKQVKDDATQHLQCRYLSQ